jgi:MoaA/NifB/PqqE/SkfB family radical SAM enzyme
MALSTTVKIVREAARARISPRFNHLILHITNLCNFRCNHCFVEFAQKPKDLTLDEIRALAERFRDLIWLDIGGGEPFLRDDLHEIVGMFRAEEVSIPTNGWFTDKTVYQLGRIAEVRDLSRVILTVSIDGLPDTHDEIRVKPGSYERLHRTYAAVRERFPSLRVKINTVLNHRNVEELIPLMERVYSEFRPDYHGILYLRGSTINPDYRLPPVERIAELEDRIASIQRRYHYGRTGLMGRVTRNYQSVKRELANRILDEKTQVVPCWGGRVHLVVYADGKVAPCELLPAVGSIRDRPIDEILTGREWNRAVERIVQKACHCTHDCNMMENILYSFSLYPRLTLGG